MLSKVARDETEYIPPKKKAKSLGYSAEYKLRQASFNYHFFAIQKNPLISFKPVNKDIHVIHRLMANYAYQEGAVTPTQDIIDHAGQRKENNSRSYLSYLSLGLLVHNVWPGQFKK